MEKQGGLNMAEVDIDKLLEKSEKQEADKKKKDIIKKAAIFGGIGAAAALIAVLIIVSAMGEKSAAYFPLEDTGKYIYNRKNKSPESWQIKTKKAMVGQDECAVLDRIDQGNFFSKQEYYISDKKGVLMLAVSKDSGTKTAQKLRILPYRMKAGLVFEAGTVKNTPITATIAEKEEMSTPVGEINVWKVEYRAGNYMDTDVWYGEGAGIIKYVDRKAGDQIDLVSRVDK